MSSVFVSVSDGTRGSCRRPAKSVKVVGRVKKNSMAVNNNDKVAITCPLLTISCLMLVTSVVTFAGAFFVKYELTNFIGRYFEDYLETPILFIIAGSVLVFADAWLGLISLARKWYRGLIMFVACTLCLLIAMIGLSTIVYMNFGDQEIMMFSRMERDLKNHEISDVAIDAVQIGLRCCGYRDFGDWANETGKNVPQSCCATLGPPCDTDISGEIHSTGCYGAIRELLDCRKWIVFVVLAVLALIEIIAITLSVTVCRNIARAINSESPDNGTRHSAALPRIRNPLGLNTLSPVDNDRTYVRRPSQLPAVLNYRSPHENFLRQPPQLRFDRRVVLPSSGLKNPVARGPR